MLERLATTPVTKLGAPEPVILDATMSGSEAVATLVERNRGAALVGSDVELRGIFTERDVLLHSVADGQGWFDRRLGELMTPHPTRVTAEASVSDALVAMHEGRFRHLPVVDDAGRPVTLVSVRDILAYVSEYFPDEVLNLPPDPSVEMQSRYGG